MTDSSFALFTQRFHPELNIVSVNLVLLWNLFLTQWSNGVMPINKCKRNFFMNWILKTYCGIIIHNRSCFYMFCNSFYLETFTTWCIMHLILNLCKERICRSICSKYLKNNSLSSASNLYRLTISSKLVPALYFFVFDILSWTSHYLMPYGTHGTPESQTPAWFQRKRSLF